MNLSVKSYAPLAPAPALTIVWLSFAIGKWHAVGPFLTIVWTIVWAPCSWADYRLDYRLAIVWAPGFCSSFGRQDEILRGHSCTFSCKAWSPGADTLQRFYANSLKQHSSRWITWFHAKFTYFANFCYFFFFQPEPLKTNKIHFFWQLLSIFFFFSLNRSKPTKIIFL